MDYGHASSVFVCLCLGANVCACPFSTTRQHECSSTQSGHAPSWPGPLGRSPLVLLGCTGLARFNPRACPLPVAEPAARRPDSIPPAVCLGSPPLVREPHSHLHRKFQHGHSRITPRTRFSAQPCVRRSGGMRASAARFTRSRCPAPSWMPKGIRRAPARSARTTCQLSRRWSPRLSSGFVSTRCSRLTAASGLWARGSTLAA